MASVVWGWMGVCVWVCGVWVWVRVWVCCVLCVFCGCDGDVVGLLLPGRVETARD